MALNTADALSPRVPEAIAHPPGLGAGVRAAGRQAHQVLGLAAPGGLTDTGKLVVFLSPSRGNGARAALAHAEDRP